MFDFVAQDAPDKRIDAACLDEAERRFGFRFPGPLREYYLQHNGAAIHEAPFVRNGCRFRVIGLLMMKYGSTPVEDMLASLEDEEELADCVPFARDEEYEYFYWLKETGEIVYIDREDVENRLPVCGSMEEFFRLLNTHAERKDDRQ